MDVRKGGRTPEESEKSELITLCAQEYWTFDYMSTMKYIADVQYSVCEIYLWLSALMSINLKAIKNAGPSGKTIMDHSIRFRIEEVLRERGQSLYWLSRAAGISYTTLWRLTKDRALGMNFATLEKMCGALECQPGDLIELTKENNLTKKTRTLPSRAVRRTSSLL